MSKKRRIYNIDPLQYEHLEQSQTCWPQMSPLCVLHGRSQMIPGIIEWTIIVGASKIEPLPYKSKLMFHFQSITIAGWNWSLIKCCVLVGYVTLVLATCNIIFLMWFVACSQCGWINVLCFIKKFCWKKMAEAISVILGIVACK